MKTIELSDAAHAKLLAFANGNDVSEELHTLLCWADEQYIQPTPGRPGKYYDTEKYKRTAAADRAAAAARDDT
tara:strand:- start:1669 stop:1887 length:219 start_codon:yes stop_codon:yes gene_type:complete